MFKIDKFQLVSLMVLYEIGTTTLFAIGIEAKQDAWIAIVIAMLIGFALLWIYTKIQQAYLDKSLAAILPAVCGKWIGPPLVFLYALYFFVNSSFNFWEFGEITVLLVLSRTPLVVVLSITLLLMWYAILLGLEVIARTGTILLPYFLGFFMLIFILGITSNQADLHHLQPVLENGIKPVIHTAIPKVVSFPFGEINVFLVYWHYMHDKKALMKINLIAVSIAGTIIIMAVVIMIMVLGIEVTSIASVPLQRVVGKIHIETFAQRLDVLAVVTFFIGGFFKMTLNFYASILLIQSLLKIKKPIWIIFPAGVCLLGFSLALFSSIVFQRWIGTNVYNIYVHPFFQIILPFLLLLVIWFQKRRGSQIMSSWNSS